MVMIVVTLALLLIVTMVLAWRQELEIRALRREVDDLWFRLEKRAPQDLSDVIAKLHEFEFRFEALKRNFLKVLVPIRSNAEDIAQLDDDLIRLEKRYEELKKREESQPPPAAA